MSRSSVNDLCPKMYITGLMTVADGQEHDRVATEGLQQDGDYYMVYNGLRPTLALSAGRRPVCLRR